MEAQLTAEQYERVLQVFWGGQSFETLQTPEELHQFAWNYNWDDGLETISEVINHPLCDKATALLIYWCAGPGGMYQYRTVDEVPIGEFSNSDYDRLLYKLIDDIETKYLSGGFPSSGIAFDPTNDQEADWTKEYRDVVKKRQIPEAMYQPVAGVQLQKANF